MRVLPVIDLKAGLVVQAIGGNRNAYLPVRSCFTNDAQPESVARALVELFDFGTVYVADLDAIAGAEPDWASLQSIHRAGLRILLDAGIGTSERARAAASPASAAAIDSIIVGLESVGRADSLPQLLSAIGTPRPVFSIDLKNGRPLTGIAQWQTLTSCEIADRAVTAGFNRLILLDLARVGTRQGPAPAAACSEIRRAHPHIELISGGGVRDASDIRALAAAGCDAVLVSSALHQGQLRKEDLPVA